MAYASIEDVRLAVGEDTLRLIADHDGDGVADEPVILRALDVASSIADGYLDDRPPVPAPPALVHHVVSIAVQVMREPRDGGTDDSRSAHASAMRWLSDLSAGKATLLSPGAQPDVPTDSGSVFVAGDVEVISRGRIWDQRDASKVF